MDYLKATKTFNVPQTTLEVYVKKCRNTNISVNKVVNQSIGRKPVFSEEMENELAHYCRVMDKKRYYSLRGRSVAF